MTSQYIEILCLQSIEAICKEVVVLGSEISSDTKILSILNHSTSSAKRVCLHYLLYRVIVELFDIKEAVKDNQPHICIVH